MMISGMKKRLMSAALLHLFALPVEAQGQHMLRTHLSAPAGAAMMGRLPGAKRLSLTMTLALRNDAQLESLLQRLYDPQSPDYHRFLTVQQFTEQFGPTAEDYQAVVDFASSHGLT